MYNALFRLVFRDWPSLQNLCAEVAGFRCLLLDCSGHARRPRSRHHALAPNVSPYYQPGISKLRVRFYWCYRRAASLPPHRIEHNLLRPGPALPNTEPRRRDLHGRGETRAPRLFMLFNRPDSQLT